MTPYQNIYGRFVRKLKDYELLSQTQEDGEYLMAGWLTSAIPKFTKCRTNLADRDEIFGQFNNTLTELEEEMLASLMIVEWLYPEVYNVLDMKNTLGDNDFRIFSPANLLKEKKDLLDKTLTRVDQLLIDYSYASPQGIEGLR